MKGLQKGARGRGKKDGGGGAVRGWGKGGKRGWNLYFNKIFNKTA